MGTQRTAAVAQRSAVEGSAGCTQRRGGVAARAKGAAAARAQRRARPLAADGTAPSERLRSILSTPLSSIMEVMVLPCWPMIAPQ